MTFQNIARFFLISSLLYLPLQAKASEVADTVGAKPKYTLLGARVCSMYSSSRNLLGSTKKVIYDFIEDVEGVSNPTPADVIRLLNQHKHELTCSGLHIVNHAFARGKYNEIVDELFAGELYTEEVKFDFNAISYAKNVDTGKVEPMTVLDYIETVALKTRSISGSPSDQSEITGLKELLIEEFGAKRFRDLSKEDVAEWEAFKAKQGVR
tara:strand:- start:67668 stop:68297 length:630 start_codon:yes stop_codon:yes gene_type:complete